MNTEKKPSYNPNWQQEHGEGIVTAAEAVRHIQPGMHVFLGTGCATPVELVKALVARAGELTDIEIVQLITRGDAPYATKELANCFPVNSFFISANVRDIIQQGMGDYTPIFLSDIPNLFRSGRMPLDVAMIQVTPPDENGMCSLGVSVDITKSAAQNARLVIAQVNPRMPRTLGDSMIHVFDIDYLVPVDVPIIENIQPVERPGTEAIGEHLASLVEDGSTIQLGIGRVPQALAKFLSDKKDLGMHTELLTDSVIDLIESGVINGSKKSVDRGKVVASFAMGSQRLYDYIDNNPVFSFNPTEYVNDPGVISRQNKMVAINVGLEVDLTGQVCADSIGHQFYSGIGGQVDFNRGAARSEGGKAIIALYSTTGAGKSRIVSTLTPGAGVVSTRGSVHWVVTEHGVAYLHGKTVQERSLALISIAHPDYREQLLKDAIEMKYVRSEMADFSGRISVGPKQARVTMLMQDGTQITIRPVHPTDEPKMRDLFHALSQGSIYTRFMSRMKWVPRRQVQDFVFIDHRNEVSIVATVPEADGDSIVALGGYYVDRKTNRAEVAFTVQDDWQSRHIGTNLFKQLVTIARRNGIAGFTAEVLDENKAMQSVFNNSGLKVNSAMKEGVYHYEMIFD
jgi:acyl-CoA hydrolase/N-acetylglutamate synthase-like GNAT family acetyltransferase